MDAKKKKKKKKKQRYTIFLFFSFFCPNPNKRKEEEEKKKMSHEICKQKTKQMWKKKQKQPHLLCFFLGNLCVRKVIFFLVFACAKPKTKQKRNQRKRIFVFFPTIRDAKKGIPINTPLKGKKNTPLSASVLCIFFLFFYKTRTGCFFPKKHFGSHHEEEKKEIF